jgi:hypothetical protein
MDRLAAENDIGLATSVESKFCHHCHTLLIPGINCHVRVVNNRDLTTSKKSIIGRTTNNDPKQSEKSSGSKNIVFRYCMTCDGTNPSLGSEKGFNKHFEIRPTVSEAKSASTNVKNAKIGNLPQQGRKNPSNTVQKDQKVLSPKPEIKKKKKKAKTNSLKKMLHENDSKTQKGGLDLHSFLQSL